jgi:hypothetical protein
MSTVFNGIDSDYRPKTYFWAHDLRLKLPSDIAGAERRRLYEAAVEGGEPSVFLTDPDFSSEHLDHRLIQAWGGFHPSHLGGEFLPRRRNEEVEIARIVSRETLAAPQRRSGGGTGSWNTALAISGKNRKLRS